MSLEKDITEVKKIVEKDLFRPATPKELTARRESIPQEMREQAVDEYMNLVTELHSDLEDFDGVHTSIVNFEDAYALPSEFKRLFLQRVSLAAKQVTDAMYELETIKEEMDDWESDHMQVKTALN